MAKNPFEFNTHEIGITAEEFYAMVHKIPDFFEDSGFEDFDEETISPLGKESETISSTNPKIEAEISIGTNSRDCDDSKESNPADSILKFMKSIINPFLNENRKIKSQVKQQDVASDGVISSPETTKNDENLKIKPQVQKQDVASDDDVISNSETTENDDNLKLKPQVQQQDVASDDVIASPETTDENLKIKPQVQEQDVATDDDISSPETTKIDENLKIKPQVQEQDVARDDAIASPETTKIDENLKIKPQVQQQDVVIDDVISNPETTKNDEQNQSVDEKFELSSSVDEISKPNNSIKIEPNSSNEGNRQDEYNNKYYYLQKEQPNANGSLHDSKSDSVGEEPSIFGDTVNTAPNGFVMEVYETNSDFLPKIEVKEGSEGELDGSNHDYSHLKTKTDGKAEEDSFPQNYERTKMNDNGNILRGKEYNDCHKGELNSDQKMAISEYNFPNVQAETPSQFKTNDKVIKDSFPIRYVPENYESTQRNDNEKVLIGKEYNVYQKNRFNSDQKRPITEQNFPMNLGESPRQEEYLFKTNGKVVDDRLPIRYVPEKYEPTRRIDNDKVLLGKENNDCSNKKFDSDYETAISEPNFPMDHAELPRQEEYLFKTNKKVVEDRVPIYDAPERYDPTIKNYRPNEKILIGKENDDYQKHIFDSISDHNFRNNPAESHYQEEPLPNNSQDLYDFARNLFLTRRRKLNRFPEDSENPSMDLKHPTYSLRPRQPVNDEDVVVNVETFLSGLTSIIE